jgi:tRNA-dihydrouridine synthase B
MIGRAAIGHPWIFREVKHYLKTGEHMAQPTLAERLDACREHVMHSIEWKGNNLGLLEMRRHYGPYFRGLENIKGYRSRLVQTLSAQEVYDILGEIENHYSGLENMWAKPNTPNEVYAGFDA